MKNNFKERKRKYSHPKSENAVVTKPNTMYQTWYAGKNK